MKLILWLFSLRWKSSCPVTYIVVYAVGKMILRNYMMNFSSMTIVTCIVACIDGIHKYPFDLDFRLILIFPL